MFTILRGIEEIREVFTILRGIEEIRGVFTILRYYFRRRDRGD